MPRKPREDYAGAWHHVTNRGIAGNPIFSDDDDCQLFLDAIGDVADRFTLEVHAYALIPSDYHLLVRSVRGNLSRSMRHFSASYTQMVNRRLKREGPLFRGRFRNVLIQRDEHLSFLLAYIHLNPVRAGLVRRITDECWTSHRAYMGLEEPHPWLRCDEMTELAGGSKELGRWISSLRSGRKRWPEELDVDTGIITISSDSRSKRRSKSGANKPLSIRAVIRRVTALTGSRPAALRTVAHGPRANPARRFAVWALVRSAGLTYREVGGELEMSQAQVANTMSRFHRLGYPDSIKSWVDDWLAGEAE